MALSALPFVAYASDQDVVVVTAQPGGNITCPQDFEINLVSLYEIELSWLPATGGNTTGSAVTAAYGRWPTGADDGFEVYNGSGNETTLWVNTEFIGVDVYIGIWATYGNDTYSECYLSGSVTGGEGLLEIGSQLGNLSDYIRIAFILGFPLILGLVGAQRHSLSGYLAGIVGFALAIPLLDDTLGLVVVIPASIFIVGLLGAGVRDAFGDGMNIV